METISIMDGLVLTVVSMFVVFVVLGSIWGLVELVSTFIKQQDPIIDSVGTPSTTKQPSAAHPQASTNTLSVNKKHQQVAELMALVLASENEPNKKFEIIESKRVK